MSRYVDERGFTLVEVIVSIAVLGILITPIFTLMNTNLKLNNKSKEQIIATSLAESEIEEMKYSEHLELGQKIIDKDGFTIETLTEFVANIEDNEEEDEKEVKDPKILYKITVEVKKNEKTIEKLLTYKSSLVGSDPNENFR